MNLPSADFPALDGVDTYLADVRSTMAAALSATPLGRLISDFGSLLGTGKMLRSRMAYRLQRVTEVPAEHLIEACAAVEMVHAASLLHDDVIDGGMVRRGAPTFWLERGISGAILLGDLLLFKALDITCKVPNNVNWTPKLVHYTGEVCEAEAEQELILRGSEAQWHDCVRIARRKTGALFAFVGYAVANGDTGLADALQEAGYAIGTAYQLADDILDATGTEQDSGKTLGTDEARHKTTAISAAHRWGGDPVARIEALCGHSLEVLQPWGNVQDAWRHYLDVDILPALDRNLRNLAKALAIG
jgi:geranylgeranyl pyrophosphate synthase